MLLFMKIHPGKTASETSGPNLQNLIHARSVLMFLNNITGPSEATTIILLPSHGCCNEIILDASDDSWPPEDEWKSQGAPELHC